MQVLKKSLTLGLSPRGLSTNNRPQLDPLQNQSPDYISWSYDPKQNKFSQPAMVSVEDLEKQPQFTGSMPTLPVDAMAKAASDLESEQENDKNKENGGTVAPLFSQVNQASNSTAGPPLLQPLDWLTQPRLDPMPAKVSVEAVENQPPFNPKWIMPPLPVAAKATSDPKTDPPSLLQPLDWLTQPRLDPMPTKGQLNSE